MATWDAEIWIGDLPEALAGIVRLEDPIEPDPENVAAYAGLFERWVVDLRARTRAVRIRPRPPDVVAGRRPVTSYPPSTTWRKPRCPKPIPSNARTSTSPSRPATSPSS